MKKIKLDQNPWSRTLISFIFGLLGTLAFSPFDIWLTAPCSLFGLQFLIINLSKKQAFLTGFSWGIGLFFSGIHWVYISISNFGGMPFIINICLIIFFIAYLSFYPALFSYILNRFFPDANVCRFIFAAPSIWQLTEYLRCSILTGFPWLQFGYTQIDGPLKNISPIFGVEMITFLLVLISNFFVFSVIKRKFIPLFLGIIILYSPIIIKNYNWITPVIQKKSQIVLVQGNITQNLKWKTEFLKNIMSIYFSLSKPYIGNADIIIWPESAIPSLELHNNIWLTSLDHILRSKKTHLITGIVDAKKNKENIKKYFNTIIVLGEKKPYQYPTKNRYQKHHLVPFGEFVPLEKILRPIAPLFNLPMSNFSSGYYYQKPLIVGNIHLNAAICYEIILGKQIRDNFQPNVDFLLSIANDAWFGNSIGPWQHLQMARMRALELGRPLLNATNNGVTAVITPYGNIQSKLPQFTRSVLYTTVIPMTGMTPYALWSHGPMWGFVILFIILAFVNNKNKFFL
ncbi:apolipoprotein N-acyltransferase [Arsenophonus symbiont of Ornithomya chloropus]|uniref:apolipoprotein N-acyltransferase n=1 Tax=Arsenophonus symbiont of Ornithomya chloropus TaxID=634121 RepID=UPI0032B1E251